MREKALEDVIVVDLSFDIAGSYCAKMLADYGADVIKVEEPGKGDIMRWRGPYPNDKPDPEKSLPFLFFNTNKRGITLNLRKSLGARIFKRIIEKADILVENFPPGTMESFGLGHTNLENINPRLIFTSITAFGQNGPYRDWKSTDLVQYAISGFMNLSGNPRKSPLQHALSQAQFMAARNGVVATMAALYFQRETGKGQYIDVSTMEAIAVQPPFQLSQYSYLGEVATRGDNPTLDGAYLEFKDGRSMCMTTNGGAPFTEFAKILDLPELLNSKYATSDGRMQYDDDLADFVSEKTKNIDAYELFHTAENSRLAFGVVQTPEDILDCPQMEARSYFQKAKHPKVGELRYPGGCFKMNETPAQIIRPAPLLGEHNQEIYCGRLGFNQEDLVKLTEMRII